MRQKKAQINKVFVYLLSLIIILFVGFLVVKFIMTFTSDVDKRTDSAIYKSMQNDFATVYRTYGAEKFFKYKVSSQVENICFISDINCIDDSTIIGDDLNQASIESLKIVYQAGDNVVIFGKDDIINSQNIGSFKVKDGCLCIKPNNNLLNLVFENNQNQVWIRENN